MAFTRMTASVENVSALANKPNVEGTPPLNPDQLKAVFDKAGVDIQDYINNTLIDEMEDDGAENIGVTEITGVTGDTVQEVLEDLKVQLDGISEGFVSDGSITAQKLADLAVTSAKLALLAVQTGNLADAAVTAAKLATDAVETAKIKDGNVTTAKLAAAAVTHEKLGQNAVEAGNIKNGAVTEDKIAANAVTFGKIANGAVGNAKLAASAVTNSKTDFSSGLYVGDLKFYGTCFGDSLPGSGAEGRIFFVKV